MKFIVFQNQKIYQPQAQKVKFYFGKNYLHRDLNKMEFL